MRPQPESVQWRHWGLQSEFELRLTLWQFVPASVSTSTVLPTSASLSKCVTRVMAQLPARVPGSERRPPSLAMFEFKLLGRSKSNIQRMWSPSIASWSPAVYQTWTRRPRLANDLINFKYWPNLTLKLWQACQCGLRRRSKRLSPTRPHASEPWNSLRLASWFCQLANP